MTNPVKFVHADLDETPQGEIILRGVLDNSSLQFLLVGDYQRDVLPLASINQLVRAFDVGTVPDIELGMRGEDFREENPVVLLNDAVYIIDGLQRVSAAKLKINRADAIQPRLGAVVHINTTEVWERERFRILNMERSKLSPNVLLRNWRYDFPVMELLFALNSERGFVLQGRVCWAQRMSRQELITATTLAKVAGKLHSHLGPTSSGRVMELTQGLQKVMEKIGKGVFRDNVRLFYDLIDQAWGVRRVAFKEGANYLHLTYQLALARVLSNHENFWRGNRLMVEAPLVRKIASFPCRDPQIVQLSSAGGKAIDMLYMLMVNHINSGKRTKRLVPRIADYPVPTEASTEEESEQEEPIAS